MAMSWRDKMRVDPSNAEIQVTEELQRQGITELERDWVLIIASLEIVPMRKERATIQYLEGLRFTLPDWFSKRMKAVYLDGPMHKKGKTVERDYWINTWLRERACDVLRIPYNGRRLSHERLKEVVAEIREFLGAVKGAHQT